jgi:hypothetical protein
MDKGNCFKGVMNKSGWKEVTDKYCMFSGLRHTRDQFSSRMQQLRQEWAFCNKLRSGSGLGRLADGTVDAIDDWREKETQVHVNYPSYAHRYT